MDSSRTVGRNASTGAAFVHGRCCPYPSAVRTLSKVVKRCQRRARMALGGRVRSLPGSDLGHFPTRPSRPILVDSEGGARAGGGVYSEGSQVMLLARLSARW